MRGWIAFIRLSLGILLGILAASPVQAARFTTYLAPNEIYPQDLVPLLSSYQEGALVSVGTERALMTAILAKKVTSIVQVDNDAKVIRYNLINRELLQVAKNREDYVHLRLNAGASEWQKRALVGQSLMANPSEHRWWMANFKRDRVGFYDFHRAPLQGEPSIRSDSQAKPFLGAHYLFDDVAFARIHDLAIRGRIDIHQGSLQDEFLIWSILSDVRSKGPISLVDISNTWWDHFAGVPAAYLLSRTLKSIDPKALIVFTDRVSVNPYDAGWSYHLGVPGEDILILDMVQRAETRPSKKYLDFRVCGKLLK